MNSTLKFINRDEHNLLKYKKKRRYENAQISKDIERGDSFQSGCGRQASGSEWVERQNRT